MPIIEASGLARTFRAGKHTIQAVRGVGFTVEPGEIIGFLGPNGAGKTTTFRMLTTLLRPTAGRATIAGADLLTDPRTLRRRIGYVAQSGGTDANCLLIEELILQARLYRMSKCDAVARATRLVTELDLTGLERRPVRTLSGGQRRRLDIALGLVHEPVLVFLDEPTTGLDPQSRSHLWDHIRRLRGELGTTIFLSTHYLDEADALCDRLLVIDHGRIVAEGSPEELKRRVAGDVVMLTVDGEPDDAKAVVAECQAIRDVAIVGQTLRLTADPGEEIVPTLTRAMDKAALRVRSIQVARPTLDDVFLDLTGRSLRDDSPSSR